MKKQFWKIAAAVVAAVVLLAALLWAVPMPRKAKLIMSGYMVSSKTGEVLQESVSFTVDGWWFKPLLGSGHITRLNARLSVDSQGLADIQVKGKRSPTSEALTPEIGGTAAGYWDHLLNYRSGYFYYSDDFEAFLLYLNQKNMYIVASTDEGVGAAELVARFPVPQ